MHHDIQLEMPSCPQCRKARLEVADPLAAVICPQCRIVYPVHDGIPFLFREAAFAAGVCTADTGKISVHEKSPDCGVTG